MAEPNVLLFQDCEAAVAPTTRTSRDLFGSEDQGRGKVAFFDINAFDQETFLRLLARNAIRSVTDLRPCPVFGRPKFQHDSVIAYLYRNDIEYFELALANRVSAYSISEGFQNVLQRVLANGLMLCLYDEEARKKGWLYLLRREIRNLATPGIEINPRALAECPASVGVGIQRKGPASEK